MKTVLFLSPHTIGGHDVPVSQGDKQAAAVRHWAVSSNDERPSHQKPEPGTIRCRYRSGIRSRPVRLYPGPTLKREVCMTDTRELTLPVLPLHNGVVFPHMVVTLRIVGMPPPAIVLVAGPVLVRAVPLDADAMAVLLVAASIFGFLISPASLTSAIVSSLTGWSPVEVSLSRQAPFVFLAGALSCVYVLLIS